MSDADGNQAEILPKEVIILICIISAAALVSIHPSVAVASKARKTAYAIDGVGCSRRRS